MRKLFIFILFTAPIALMAQTAPLQSVILNDGSRIMGTIISDSTDHILFKIKSPQVITLSKSQIAKTETFETPFMLYSRDKGYFIHFTSSMLAGKNDWGDAYTMSFQLSNGYQLKNGLSLGIGTGIEHFGVPLIPLYAEFKYHPWNSRISPYAYLRSGYSFALADQETIYYEDYNYPQNDQTGGFLFNGGIGIALFTWQSAAVSLGLGYRYQKVTVTRYEYWWSSTTSREYITYFNRFEVQLGLIFR